MCILLYKVRETIQQRRRLSSKCGTKKQYNHFYTECRRMECIRQVQENGKKIIKRYIYYLHSCLTTIESLSSLEKAVGVAPLPSAEAAMAERLLTGEALALADVEFVMLVGAAGVGVEPLVLLDAVLPGDVPLIFFVASLTSWNFSINWFQ